MNRFVTLSLLVLHAFTACAAVAAARPKLILHLSVDQLRPDFLIRFAPHFLSPRIETNGTRAVGGFEYLKTRGTWFVDARHTHYPLFTGPGHSVQLTGAQPYKSGIVGNYWFDAHDKNGRRYCVEDLTSAGDIIGTGGVVKKEPRISPVTLEVSTVGDELRIATGNKSKVWSVALKDRAAVLMGGHLANGALWFDEESGDWISSRYYRTNALLPDWVQSINRKTNDCGKRFVDTFTNAVWKSELPASTMTPWTGESHFVHVSTNKGYKQFTFTPFANAFVLGTAQQLIEKENLGEDEITDLLALNFSSNDYVGHNYGADSAEVFEITTALDKQLSAFFSWLDQRFGLGNIVIVLTSDHGAAPFPHQARTEAHFDADIADERAIETEINQTLQRWYGLRNGKTNAATVVEYNLYVHEHHLESAAPAHEIHSQLADYLLRSKKFGYYAAYTREDILEGRLPRTDIGERVSQSFHPENSGDVVLVPRAFWIHLDPKYKYKTSHGSPYSYDTAAPLLIAGAGIRSGKSFTPVSTLDIAPTLSWLCGILPPSGSEGRILEAAVGEPTEFESPAAER